MSTQQLIKSGILSKEVDATKGSIYSVTFTINPEAETLAIDNSTHKNRIEAIPAIRGITALLSMGDYDHPLTEPGIFLFPDTNANAYHATACGFIHEMHDNEAFPVVPENVYKDGVAQLHRGNKKWYLTQVPRLNKAEKIAEIAWMNAISQGYNVKVSTSRFPEWIQTVWDNMAQDDLAVRLATRETNKVVAGEKARVYETVRETFAGAPVPVVVVEGPMVVRVNGFPKKTMDLDKVALDTQLIIHSASGNSFKQPWVSTEQQRTAFGMFAELDYTFEVTN